MFSFDFTKIREYFMRFIKPSLYMGGIDYFLSMWKTSDTKDRGILLLVFAPMFVCFGGFVLSIMYFVLFVLPSYLFRIIGWVLLMSLFGMGGKYAYTHFTKRQADFIDVQYTDADKI